MLHHKTANKTSFFVKVVFISVTLSIQILLDEGVILILVRPFGIKNLQRSNIGGRLILPLPFDQDEVNIYDAQDTIVTVTRGAVLRGWRDHATGLWRVLILKNYKDLKIQDYKNLNTDIVLTMPVLSVSSLPKRGHNNQPKRSTLIANRLCNNGEPVWQRWCGGRQVKMKPI